MNARTRTGLSLVLLMLLWLVIPAEFLSSAAQEGARPGGPPPAGAPAGGRGFNRPEGLDFNDHAGWTSMFDGKTMSGWDANPAVWKVEDGAITAESTAERRVGSTYVIWRGEEV